MKKLLVSFVLCMVLVFSVTVGFAAQNNTQKNNSAVNINVTSLIENEISRINVEPNATRDYAFKILIPNTGITYDPYTYTMSAGKYCIVQRTDSVNRSAVFRVVDARTHTPLGDWKTVWNGDSKLIYTNTSGTTQSVIFELSSENVTSFYVQGYYKFGEF